ncbi:MAG: FmdB family zinc ribbon protein [Anaerolineae bacterium]
MPTYEYKCDACGVVFERFQHFSEDPLDTCPECGGPAHRVIQPVGIIFKGNGFYITDNRGDTSSLMPKKEEKESKDAGTNGDSKEEKSGSA